MKTRARRCGALAVAILITSAVVQNQDARNIQGTVVTVPPGSPSSSSLKPVANAHVEYEENSTGNVRETTTDANGQFEFPAGQQGIVTASKPGLVTISMSWPPRNDAWQLRMVLPNPATVRGTLLDMTTKQAVVDGTVTLIVEHPANLVSDAAHADNGRFQFDDLPPGPAVLMANANGFAPYLSTMTIKEGEVYDARIPLLLEGAVRGSVVDSSRAPVGGAVVSLVYSANFAGSDLLESFVSGRILTGSDGEFAVSGIVPDTPFQLYAESESGSRSEARTLTVAPGLILDGVVLQVK